MPKDSFLFVRETSAVFSEEVGSRPKCKNPNFKLDFSELIISHNRFQISHKTLTTMCKLIKQRVTFSNTEQINVVDTIDQEEKSSLWYTKQDLAASQSESCVCSASVECLCQVGSDNEGRRQFVKGLLQQQLEHKRLGVYDPKGLFQFSRACTKHSRKRAQQLAKTHEQEVRRLSRENTLEIIDDVLNALDL